MTTLRELFDAHARVTPPDRPELVVTRDGPLVRTVGGHRGLVTYRDLAGARGSALDAMIARTCRFFKAPFEWKTYAHDAPADLPKRLRDAGFVAEATETVAIADAAAVAAAAPPAGVRLREVVAADELRRIARAKAADVPDDDVDWLADDLAARVAANPDGMAVIVAEYGGEPICSAWVVFNADKLFAGLWGASTAHAWRGRGVYRALVAYRAQLAAARGYRYLYADALDTSWPILEKLGFVAVTQTTPYVWKP